MPADIREDRSEIIHYDNPEFPVFCRFNEIPANAELRDTSLHWHEDIEFIYVTTGSIIQNINGKSYVLRAGEGMFINANQIHDVENNGEYIELYCLIFKPTILCAAKYMEDHFVTPVTKAGNIPYIFLQEKNEWDRQILYAVQKIVDFGIEGSKELLIISKLNEMWHLLYDHLGIDDKEKPTENIGLTTFKKMVEFVQAEYTGPLTLSDLCRVGGVGKTKCSELFNEYVHLSPVEYIICYRLEVAAKLLRETDRSISDIAYECGFSGASYFSESFKKRVGLAPNEYRRRERE